MNEDELRAFLEGASAGDSDADSDAGETGKSFEELMQMKRGGSAEPSAATPAAESPSNDAVPPAPTLPTPAAPAPTQPTTPAPRAAQPPQAPEPPEAPQNDELTPIVLPGPPKENKAANLDKPFWEPRRAAEQAPADPVPTMLPATEPLPVGDASAAALAADGPPPIEPDPVDDLFASEPLPAPPTGEYEKIEVVGSEKSRFVPWVIVGAGAVLAIIASLIVVFAVRGGETPPPVTEPTTQSPVEPTTEQPTEPTEEPVEPTEEPAPDEAPEVEVGNTGSFNIESWGVQGEISAKFGWPSYTISGNTLTFEGGTLLPQFPESCAAMRTGFGFTRLDDGSFEVHRPAETCAESPDFYNEVWGLTAAIIPTLKSA